MVIKEALLALITYPEATPDSAIWDAAAIAETLSSKLSAITNEVRFQLPGRVHPLADALIDIPGLAAAQTRKSTDNAENLLRTFNQATKQHGVLGDVIRETCFQANVSLQLAEHARYADLCIVPIFEGQRRNAEEVIFNSGRPTLIIPCSGKGRRSFALTTAVIAWDGSRAAARAVGDALAVLQMAKHVRIVVAAEEKTLQRTHSIKKLMRYLHHHGISATVDGMDVTEKSAAEAISEHVTTHQADLLVIGAFAHSRIRDFILGGVTAKMLLAPPVPVFMSH
jgi:nucleotide-binding universal stress UspA family protein